MRPIDVDTSSYESARDTFYDVDSQACDAVLIAATGADGGGGMAGSDSTGADWARQYDQAASQALQAGGTLTETLGHIGDLLGASAANHGNADSSSIPGGGPSYGGGSGKGASTVYPATPPSANGTPGDEPHGWFLIAHLLSWTWPNGHQDQLRSVGSAWTRGGQALQDDSLGLFSAIGQIESLQSPEVAAAAQTCRDVQSHMADLGSAYSDIGKTCSDYAGFLDEAHHDVISELESLVAWTAGIEGLGFLGSLVTFGGAEVPAQAAEAGRIARTAARVGEILSKLAELTRGVIAVLARALGKVGEVLAKLKSLLGKGVSRALAKLAPRLRSDWPKLSGMLRSASRGKGNFGIGAGTREQAGAMGEAWVGPDATLASDGKTLVSKDGLRQYRPPSFKPNLDKVQANFEQRYAPSGKWQGNGHLDITD